MTTSRNLLFICLAALVLRLVLIAAVVRFPGIADPNHYYNVGARWAQGDGLTFDYVWMYNPPPASVTHPEDHWMPLASLLAGVPMTLFGVQPAAALIGFALIGSLLPALAFWGARQLALRDDTALFAAAATAVIPELVLNSVRTDTTIPFAFLICLCLLCLVRWTHHGKPFALIVAGIAAGLAYLTRNDALLIVPMGIAVAVFYALIGAHTPTKRRALIAAVVAPLIALIVVSPWLIRNLNTLGRLGSGETDDMFFFTHHNDHYAFDQTFTLATLLERQTPADIIGKRAFELAAAFDMMIGVLGDALAVGLAASVLLLVALRRTERPRWAVIAPTLIILLGAVVAYAVFIPYKSQAGSTKKFFLALIPLLIPLAAYALERAITDARIRAGAMILIVLLLGANAIEFVRQDANFVATYRGQITAMSAIARELPDVNGDGQLIFMTQDPFMLAYEGLSSVMYPYPDRASVDGVIDQYAIDYLLMPPDRPVLDPIYWRTVVDARFTFVRDVPRTTYEFWRVEPAS